MNKARAQRHMGPVLAVAIAGAVAGIGFWLLERPVRTLSHLIESRPAPALLDQPFRHQFARPAPSPIAPSAH